jgi:hypothetical protein
VGSVSGWLEERGERQCTFAVLRRLVGWRGCLHHHRRRFVVAVALDVPFVSEASTSVRVAVDDCRIHASSKSASAMVKKFAAFKLAPLERDV